MAIGRITGPLLASNLQRDGINLAFDGNKLYIDVNNERIGINTAAPKYTLDVQGDTYSTNLKIENVSTLSNLTISNTDLGTLLSNSLGDLFLQSPIDNKIQLNNDTLVTGNLHATGNITANGSVQLGNNTGTDTLSIYADIISDITPLTSGQYDLGAPGKEWAQGYIDTLVASALTSGPGQDVNITPPFGQVTNINSNVRIWGNNPLGTGPVTQNVLYVNMDGSDTNDGRAQDPTRACRTITGAIRSPFYKEGTSIKVAPGRYLEDNPLELKRLTSVIGSDLRTTYIEPINKTQDLFHVRSGCYIAQLQMTNGQSGLLPGTGYTPGTNRGAYAVAFPPNYGQEKIDLYYSPYIQNCTNQSGPWLMDGTMFIPNQTVQIPEAVGTSTWVANTTTLLVSVSEGTIQIGQTINIGPTQQGYVNARTLLLANKSFFQEQVIAYIDQKDEYFKYDQVKCERDTGLIVDSLISDLLFESNGYTQSNFAGLQYWNQDGYVGLIANELTTTTNAVTYIKDLAKELIVNQTVGGVTRYSTSTAQNTSLPAASNSEQTTINTEFNLILDILTNGTSGITDSIELNGSTKILNPITVEYAYNILQINKPYIQAQAIIHINENNSGFSYSETKCRRDVNYMIDSVCFDLLYGGNRQAIQSAVYYFNYSTVNSAISKERPQTSAAYFRIRQIIDQLFANEIVTKSPGNLITQLTSLSPATSAEADKVKGMIDLITKIIDGGPEAALTPSPISLTRSTDQNVLNAINILKDNKAFIVSEVIGFVETTYNDGFAYNQPKCSRDTGLIVDSIGIDLLYGSKTQSTFAGIQYWNQNGYTGLIESELTATTAAIDYVSVIAQRVIQNDTEGFRYQTTLTQATSFIFDQSKCQRDTGLIVDALAQDLLFTTSSQSTFAGLQYWNHGAYVGLIPNEITTTTNAIAHVRDLAKQVIVNSTGTVTRYSTSTTQNTSLPAASNSEQTTIDTEFNLILDILTNGITVVTDRIVQNELTASTDQNVLNAYTILQENKLYIREQTIEFINATNLGFSYSETKCRRDIEYMIDSISFDLLYSGNRQAIQSAVYYFSFNESSTALPNEQVQTVSAYNYLKKLLVDVITGTPVFSPSQTTVSQITGVGGTTAELTILENNIDLIKNIISNGPSVVIEKTPISLIRSTDENVNNAVFLLNANRAFIVAEVLAYINSIETYESVQKVSKDFGVISNILTNGTAGVTNIIEPNGLPSTSSYITNAVSLLKTNKEYIKAQAIAFVEDNKTNGFSYTTSTCARDVGYMIDCVTFDLLHGGNRQAVQSGVYYYSFNSSSTAIANEIPQTTAAYNHIRQIISEIVTNQLITKSVGNTATQITSFPSATTVEITSLYDKIDRITEIINNGPSVVSVKEPIDSTTSLTTSAINAFNLLMANKEFIKAETIAFINLFDTGFVYNRAKCSRDVGIVVENIAYDIAFGGNQKSVESGIAYWNGVTSYIPNEITETTDAFNYLKTLAQNVVSNTTCTNLMNTYQKHPQVINTVLTGGEVASGMISNLIKIINDTIQNIDAAPTLQVGNGPDWGSVSAEVLLQANRSFIQNEVLDWINNTYSGFSYREDKCYRDTGLIVDAISQDIILNANAKTIEAAKTYWTGNKNVLENAGFGTKNQVIETVAAINRAKEISLQIINNTTVTNGSSFIFNPNKCSRDTGLIVDALAQDLLFEGDSQTTFAGIQYWNHGDYVGQVNKEIVTTTNTINYISQLAQRIVQNDQSGTRYQNTLSQITSSSVGTITEANIIAKNFSTVTNILTNGVIGVTNDIIPNNLTASGDANVKNSYKLLQDNIDYLKAEAIAYVEANKNFRYNETKCLRDTGIIVDSMVIDLAYPTEYMSQSTFAGLQYWGKGSYTGEISRELTTTTAAINWIKNVAKKVIQNDLSGFRYAAGQVTGTAATSVQATVIESKFNVITGILTGTIFLNTLTDIIVANSLSTSTDLDVVRAYELLVNNKSYLQDEAIGFVGATTSVGYNYNSILCARDVGYMIDSVAFDLLHGGNRQSIQSGVYYYNFDGSSAIPDETYQTVAAFQFIKSLSLNLIQNIEVTPLQDIYVQDISIPSASSSVVAIENLAHKIIKIIEEGSESVRVKEPVSLIRTSNDDQLRAAEILNANRSFIQAETIAFINSSLTYQYDQTICARDVGYIVNSVAFDLLYSGNRQSIQSGVYYWGYSESSTSLPKERVASTLAYQYMKEIIAKIITATAIPTSSLYQQNEQQVTNLPAATSAEVLTISANIDKITTIINDGPLAAGEKQPIKQIPSNNQFVRNAVTLLHENRDFIKAEVNAYVDQTQVSNSQIFLPFYDKGANATLSVIRNFDIITNIIKNGLAVAPIASDGNGIFVKSGLSPDDVLSAPVVVSVTTVSSGVYQIDISQTTIGFGDSQSLYFGQTQVFPLLDAFVDDRWQQRRINPIGSMGGALIDGGVISDRSPITSFVFDAFTQVNQGGNGVFVTNNGYAQLVSVFTIFCSNAVTVENGGICSITNSNSNFGDICLTAKGYGKREFSGYIKNPPVLPYYPNGVYPNKGQVNVYIADPLLRPHIALVMEVEPPEGHINNRNLPGFLSGNTNIDTLTAGTIEITGIDNTGMVVGQKFYVVDQYGRQVDDNNQPYVKPGTIVANVGYQSVLLNYPLNSGGGEPGNINYFNLYSCGNAYYTVLSSELGTDPVSPGTLLLPNNQNIEEALSLDFINTLSQQIIQNNTVTSHYSSGTQIFDVTQSGGAGASSFISNRLDLIGGILVNGPESTPTITYTGTLPTGSKPALSLLSQNKTFIQDEVIAYVDQNFFNFSYDRSKCSRDTGLIVDAIVQDLLFDSESQSTFAGIQYWNQNGERVGLIQQELSTTTAAINYVKSIVQDIVQGNTISKLSTGSQVTENLPSATSAEAEIIGSKFSIINNILTGTISLSTVTDLIVSNSIVPDTNINITRAYNLLQANKTFIQQEAIAYVETHKTNGFTYTTSTCARDIGYMIDSVSIDLLYGGNRQSVQSGVYYFGYNTSTNAVASELTQTIDAYNHITNLTQAIVLGQEYSVQQTVVPRVTSGYELGSISEVSKIDRLVSNITNIISNGPTATISNVPLPTTASSDINAIYSARMLSNNKDFIKAEAIAFIRNTFPGFSFNSTSCSRDTGLLVDAISQDLMFDSLSQSIFSGIQYWNHGSYVGAINSELTTTTNAINFVKSLAQRIVQNDQSGSHYQTFVDQNVSLPAATSAQATAIGQKFDVINNILTGTISLSTVTDQIVPNSLFESNLLADKHAFAILLANKEYIQAEAVAYVEAIKANGFSYNKEKCRRDVGYMIDAVAIDLLFDGNRQSIQAGVYYYSFANSSAINNEQSQAIATYNYIKSILPDIITGNTLSSTYQISTPQVTTGTVGNIEQATYAQSKVDLINRIITNGPQVAKIPLGVNRSSSTSVNNAAAILAANKEFIKAETIAYVNNRYSTYNKEKCRRDVGFIVDALTYDLEKGGNYNSIIAGRSYFAEHGTHHIVQLEENVTDPDLFPDGAITTFYQRSYMSASGYLFEYVGAGTNYGSLPQRGKKDPVQGKEVVQLNNGKVFFTSTDQNGDFRIGTGLVISQATGVLSGRTFTKSLFANLTPFILAIEG